MRNFIQDLVNTSPWYSYLLFSCGLTFLYTAFGIHEGEEGKIQNRLEEYWCKLDDVSNTILNFHLQIIRRFASLALTHLEELFGKKLISYQSIGVSICWGLISAKVTFTSLLELPVFLIFGQWLIIYVLWFISRKFMFLPLRNHGKWLLFIFFIWIAMIFIAYYSGTLGNKINGAPPSVEEGGGRFYRGGIAVLPLYTWGVLISVAACIVFIPILRRSFRYISETKSNIRVAIATLLHSIFLSVIISLHIIALNKLENNIDLMGYIFLINTPIMLCAYLMAIFLILLIAHLVFWGIMQRPIYLLQRIGGDRRKKLFAGIGVALLYIAFPKIGEVIKEIIKSIL